MEDHCSSRHLQQRRARGGFPCTDTTCPCMFTTKSGMVKHYQTIQIRSGGCVLTVWQDFQPIIKHAHIHRHMLHLKVKPFACITCRKMWIMQNIGTYNKCLPNRVGGTGSQSAMRGSSSVAKPTHRNIHKIYMSG